MKKILTLLLVAAMLFTLAACGGKDEPKPTGGQAGSSASGDGSSEIENKVDLSLDNEHYDIDAQIAVTLDFGKLNKNTAVIVVVNSDTEHGKAIPADDDKAWVEYRWLSDFSELPFYLFPENMKNGLYDVRVYADAESGKELACVTIAVGSATLPSDSGNSGNEGGVLKEGGDCTQKQMEDTIISYLSKISNVSSLTLSDGSRIEYTKAGEALNDFDFWTIYDPELDNKGMYETMKSQLEDAGFSYEEDTVGRHVWYIDAGGEHKGIMFWPDDDDYPDGYYILMMTHEPNKY